MASSLPNSVIQKSKKEGKIKDTPFELPGHNHVHKAPGRVIHEFVKGVDDLKYRIIVTVEDQFPVYHIEMRSWGINTWENGRRYRLRNPPSPDTPEFLNVLSWEIGVHRDPWGYHVTTGVSDKYKHAFDEAFDVICADWFFRGR